MKNENRYIVKNTGICKCGAFNSGLPRSSFLTARNDGNVVILLLFTLFIATTTAFSQQHIHTLNKDSINQSDWIGKQGIWYVFDDSTGIIHSKTTYENNLKHGYFEEYDAYGRVIRQGFYYEGMLDSVYREYKLLSPQDIKFYEEMDSMASCPYDKRVETFIEAYFDYGTFTPIYIMSPSGERIYEIECFGNTFFTYSYYDEKLGKNLTIPWTDKKSVICPRIDTIYDYWINPTYYIRSIYYNGCLYSKLYFKVRRNGDTIDLYGEYFIDEKIIASESYWKRSPYGAKWIEYFSKDGEIYKQEYYKNKECGLKKVYEWELTPDGKWQRWKYKY